MVYFKYQMNTVSRYWFSIFEKRPSIWQRPKLLESCYRTRLLWYPPGCQPPRYLELTRPGKMLLSLRRGRAVTLFCNRGSAGTIPKWWLWLRVMISSNLLKSWKSGISNHFWPPTAKSCVICYVTPYLCGMGLLGIWQPYNTVLKSCLACSRLLSNRTKRGQRHRRRNHFR